MVANLSSEEALKIRKSTGSHNKNLAKLINNIACTLKELGDARGALKAFEEALDIQRSTMHLTQSEPMFDQVLLSIFSSLSNICTVRLSLGMIEEAYDALKEALFVSRRSCAWPHFVL